MEDSVACAADERIESIVAKRPFLDLAEERGLISKADAMDAVKKAVHGG